MDALELIHRSLSHSAWADEHIVEALRANPSLTTAWREYAHVLGAASTWLARLERRPSPLPIWPNLSMEEAESVRRDLIVGFERFLNTLDADALDRAIEYTNSAGQTFRTPIVDMLQQVVSHGQYHRGKINLLLRQSGAEPSPVDYIAYARGVPAAVTKLSE